MRLSGRDFWVAQLAGWGAYGLIIWLSSLPSLGPGVTLGDLLPLKSAMAFGGLVTSLLAWALYQRLLPARASTARLVLLATLVSAALGLVWGAVVQLLVPRGRFAAGAFRGASSYGIALLAWSALYLTFTYRRRLEEEAARALRADALASEARLAMLRYQVNPHFLFNALNSIRALIDEDPRKAREMVTELSELFRYALVGGRSDAATLGDELAAVESYVAIQRIRFEEKLRVTIEASDEARSARLPSFLVHPLVENAVKYGMETSPLPLAVNVRATRDGDSLRVEVTNTGRWKEPGGDGGTGTGLANVRERLAELYPARHRLEVGEANGLVRALLELRLAPA